MKKFSLLFSLIVFSFVAQAQLVSYTLQQSFTASELDSTLTATGFALPIPPQYDIDVYQVIYKTPYKHPDSLVNVSGIVVVPKAVPCPLALACYAHGTFTQRLQVPTYNGPERPIGLFFGGIGGVLTAMPDDLGLGDCDTSVIIHTYINAFHSGHACVNIMRAARQLADTLALSLSGEVVLTGYSQGGYTTMATHKLIQEHYSNEFNVIASAPMSGPYDLKKTMVDVMLDTVPYAAPSYLPYLLLGYHSVYPSLQQISQDPSFFFRAPYDTLLPPLYYSKLYTTNYIDTKCSSVPRQMLKDSLVNDFANDTLHPLRLILAENDLMGWAPQAPVKIFYCSGDRQVSPLNAQRAYAAWTANGAPHLEIQDMGNLDHGPCVEPALTNAALFLLSKKTNCPNSVPEIPSIYLKMYPNPSNGVVNFLTDGSRHELALFDVEGRLIFTKPLTGTNTQISTELLQPGVYVAKVSNERGDLRVERLVVQK